MTDKTQYITQGSLDDLKKELELVKNKKIPEIANRIDEAKQQGDLSENAEYHQAKEDMAWAQGRLLELEQLLSNVQVIEGKTAKDGAIQVGQTVTVEVGGTKKEYTIVGPQEADPFNGKISNESPLGEAFIGRVVGDSVEVSTPAGKQIYKILKIS